MEHRKSVVFETAKDSTEKIVSMVVLESRRQWPWFWKKEPARVFFATERQVIEVIYK